MNKSITKQILNQISGLPVSRQKQVLEFVLGLKGKLPRGVPGKELVVFAGSIPPEDVRVMSKAIEEACEKVDVNAW